MDTPNFDPWTIEYTLGPNGESTPHDLYRTTIKLKKGSTDFVEAYSRAKLKNEELYLEFYSPSGLLMSAPIRRFSPAEINHENTIFDTLNILVELSSNQVLAIFPFDETEAMGY